MAFWVDSTKPMIFCSRRSASLRNSSRSAAFASLAFLSASARSATLASLAFRSASAPAFSMACDIAVELARLLTLTERLCLRDERRAERLCLINAMFNAEFSAAGVTPTAMSGD